MPVPQRWLEKPCQRLIYTPAHFLLPGFIDTHIHGIQGADVMDATTQAMATIALALAKTGTTSFLATTMTADQVDIAKVMLNLAHFHSDNKRAEMLGIHLEGPFIAHQCHGAHPKEKIIPADFRLLQAWHTLSGEKIKMITFAPETLPDPNMEFIQQVESLNIVPAVGHSAASQAQAERAFDRGAAYVTHLFNAMGCQHHRQPGIGLADVPQQTGVVAATLGRQSVTAELIVDHVHLHPTTVNTAFQVKGPDRLLLVTDAMRASCCGDGHFTLGDQAVIVKDNAARLVDGTLAGSVLTMNHALKNFLQITGCSWHDLVKMTSENAAKILDVFDRKGSIEVGKDGDLVVLSGELELVQTLCRGRLIDTPHISQ